MGYADGRVIAIDLDETCVHYLDALCGELEQFARETGSDWSDLPFPDTWSLVEAGWFDSDEDYKDFHAYCVADGIYSRLEPEPHVAECLWDLHRDGWKIHVLTSRFVVGEQNAIVVSDTATNLDRCGIPYDSITVTEDKRGVIADVYIDDSPHQISSLANAGRNVIVYTQPYNSGIENECRTLGRAGNWYEVVDIIRDVFDSPDAPPLARNW
jgi:5'(3')-deoxyribonucleotidase